MNKDEALRLALEALEKLDRVMKRSPDTDKAIIAIKQALAQEKALQALHNENERLDLYKDVYGQLEQEPVAWRNAALRVGEDLCSVGPFGYYDMTAEKWLDWALSVVTVHAPTPKLEPLTDEEIDALPFPPSGTATLRDFVRIIEAAHGIKGEA
jgi:hypothetical protein